VNDGANRAGRQHASAELVRPQLRLSPRLQSEVERRFTVICDGDRARHVCAVVTPPAGHEPRGCIERYIEVCKKMGALPDEAAKHRIHQTGIVRAAAIGSSEPNGEVDGGMAGNVEPQDLGGADEQDDFHSRRRCWQAALEQSCEQVSQSTEPSQDSCADGARKRPVAIGQFEQPGVRLAVLELLVERPAPAEHVLDKVSGRAAGQQSCVVGQCFRMRQSYARGYRPLAEKMGLASKPRNLTSPSAPRSAGMLVAPRSPRTG